MEEVSVGFGTLGFSEQRTLISHECQVSNNPLRLLPFVSESSRAFDGIRSSGNKKMRVRGHHSYRYRYVSRRIKQAANIECTYHQSVCDISISTAQNATLFRSDCRR